MDLLGFKEFELGREIGGGLSRCDVYVPEHDLVVMFDGPCHFLEQFHTSDRPMSYKEMKNLTPFYLANSLMNDKIVRHFHQRVVRFDYQAHDILY